MFGSIGTAAPDTVSANVASACFVAVVVLLVSIFWIRSWLRVRQLKQISSERGWIWLREGNWRIPVRELLDVPYGDLRLENGFEGFSAGIAFSAFDCVIGSGKHRAYVTVIAVRTEINPFGFEKWTPGFKILKSEGWFAVTLEYRIWGRRIMPGSEMLSIINNLS